MLHSRAVNVHANDGAPRGADFIDRLYATLRKPTRLFGEGWGLPESWGQRPPGLDEIVVARPAPLEPELAMVRQNPHHVVFEATLESPVETLPREVRRFTLRVIEPRSRFARAAILFFGAWGDETFALRTHLLAPLAELGVSVWLPSTPFFGSRRASGQRGIGLRTVHDFLSLEHASVQEALGLLGAMRGAGHERVGVAGFSMGGQLAALTAALSPQPLATVTIAASVSPASVFCRGPLGRAPDWGKLEQDGLGPALPRLRALFERYSVTALPVPKDPSQSIVIGTERDLIVPPEDARQIAAHWPGSHLRWLSAGHVAAVALHGAAIRRTIAELLIDRD